MILIAPRKTPGIDAQRVAMLSCIYPYTKLEIRFNLKKISYTLDEVSDITRLPQSLIRHYVRVKKVTISPEHYPDINPRLVKGKLLFTQKDIDALTRFIDKRQDESWEKWQLRRIQEIKAKRQLAEDRQEKRPNLRIVKGKEKDPVHN